MRLLFLSLIFSFLFFNGRVAQANEPSVQKHHELTLYIIPSMHPLDWSSPASLFKSMKECYLKTIGLPDNYLLGHMTVKINTPLLEKPLVMAQTSGSVQEKTDLVLKQKIGFGILGAALTGRIEPEKEIEHKLRVYAKRQKLAFITYRLNEKAMTRILTFINQYKQKINEKNAACDFYGGAFWPRYKNEGGGCSTFGMALIDLVDGLTPETEIWKKEVNIPATIIGGEFFNGRKIRNSTIKRTKRWHDGKGKLNVDYVKYLGYEPSIMYQWILDQKNNNSTGHLFTEENGIPGIIINQQENVIDESKPLFIDRPEPNRFIDVYYQKIGLN
jgi:hypothetical protein